MQVDKILSVAPANDALSPELLFRISFKFDRFKELPVSITGILKLNNKRIATLQPYFNLYSREQLINFPLLDNAAVEAFLRKQPNNINTENIFLDFFAKLDTLGIDYIESVREMDDEKAVRFQLHFEMTYFMKELDHGIDSGLNPSNTKPILGLVLRKQYDLPNININQSDWVRKFSPELGIGNFLLLEVKIPDKHVVNKDWIELYDRLLLRLKEMENSLRHGNWQMVMYSARQFYENIKIGDGKKGHKKFEEQLRKYFAIDQHTEEGTQNFLDGIWRFFEYTSKFIHDKDKQGNHNSLPIPTKEEAYFAYTLGIGLLNIIGKKVSKKS